MILDELAASTRKRIEKEKEIIPFETLRDQAEAAAAAECEALKKKDRSEIKVDRYEFAFEKALSKNGLSIISEVKKASPSKGIIAEDFPYVKIASEYEEAGADAISCLTEPERFRGSDEYLKEIVKKVKLPVLRKDFTVDKYMIYQAKLMGASAVLLIAAILTDKEMQDFYETADGLGLSCLFEAHDAEEVRRCLDAGARIVGVNNRNLKDFTVDINNSIRLRDMVPQDRIFVSESGMMVPEDVIRLRKNGTDAVLIGEMLMRSSDRKGLIAKLKAE